MAEAEAVAVRRLRWGEQYTWRAYEDARSEGVGVDGTARLPEGRRRQLANLESVSLHRQQLHVDYERRIRRDHPASSAGRGLAPTAKRDAAAAPDARHCAWLALVWAKGATSAKAIR